MKRGGTALHLFFWGVLLVLAVINGILREATYGRWLSELAAHQVSTATGIALVTFAVFAWVRFVPFATARQALGVGLAWMAATVLFEFVFGHFVIGHPWARLLHDYDLAAGRVWPVFLAWITVLPGLAYRLHTRPPGGR